MARPRKSDAHEECEAKPLFALKAHKRPSIPKHLVAMREETRASFEQYIEWAAEVLEITHEEAQSRFMEFAVSEIVNKDSAFKAHQKSIKKTSSSKGRSKGHEVDEVEAEGTSHAHHQEKDDAHKMPHKK